MEWSVEVIMSERSDEWSVEVFERFLEFWPTVRRPYAMVSLVLEFLLLIGRHNQRFVNRLKDL